jgi:hypothetical protein
MQLESRNYILTPLEYSTNLEVPYKLTFANKWESRIYILPQNYETPKAYL